MSRRSRQAAFSLFSFQDIVTSVTAILILIVLILSLEMLDRTVATAASSSRATRTGLMQTIMGLQQLVLTLESHAPVEAGLRPLALKTASELEREMQIVGDQLARAADEASSAEAIERRAAARAQEMIGKVREKEAVVSRIDAALQAAAEADSEATRRASENERTRERLVKQRQQIDGQPRSGTELVFNAPPRSDKQPWLVEVAADGVATVRLGSNERRALGAANSPGAGVSAWVQSLRPGVDYALMLVRPSGVEDYEAMRELLQTQGIDLGIDFIGEDQAVRDGSGEKPSLGGR